MITGVTQDGGAEQVIATQMTRSSDEGTQTVRAGALNQGEYVLQLVREAAEAYIASYAEQEVPAEGLPGENLDATA
jgi:hypothetical protein